jgi:hypothetical protein
MSYLICRRCGGYYKLKWDESVQDFVSCECGGELVYTEKIMFRPSSKNNRSLLILAFLMVIIVLGAGFLAVISPNSGGTSVSNPSLFASDNKGLVTKDVYSTSNTSVNKKSIVIITGMHPREKLSESVVSDVIQTYSLSTNQEIVHYDINVTDQPEDFYIGRNNGEELAASYILPDILKSNADLVIICHNHAPWYGQGYYIATPKMDPASVQVAESLNQTLKDFNYYKVSSDREHSSSAIRLSYPLASAGFRTLVYEIPESATYTQASQETRNLIIACFRMI